jgi:hydrogenase maturation protease
MMQPEDGAPSIGASANSCLLLALGNDILGDDAIGLEAARRMAPALCNADVIEHAGSGFGLIDILSGYKKTLILDSIVTGKNDPGAILEFTSADFERIVASSPHYVGLPEVVQMARCLDIPFPDTIHILAVEIEDALTIREGLSENAMNALPNMIRRANEILSDWMGGAHA